MNRFVSLFLTVLLLGLTLFSPASAGELSPSADKRASAMMERLLTGRLQEAQADSLQDWISGTLANDAGLGAEWYVLGLSQHGSYDFSAYTDQLRRYLDNTTVRSATSRQKYALAFLASGASDPYITAVMEDSIGQQGIMSWIYGLHLLTNGQTSTSYTADDVLAQLLVLQLPDGGWAVSGNTADVDVTAMALQALAPYMDTANVSSAIDRALALLMVRQQDSGGYMSYGTDNPESCAQVLTALSALGIDALQDARFIRDGHDLLDAMQRFQLEDGSFSHTLGGESSTTATMQTFYALIAYDRCVQGLSPLYVLDQPLPAVPAKAELSGKAIAVLSIIGLSLLLCIVLFLLHKRHWKNFAAVGLTALLAIGFVLVTNFQTADSYYTVALTKENTIGNVTLTIRCDTVAGRADHIPADGVILAETSFPIAQGDTVYTILTEAARAYGIPMENTGARGMAYIAGINNLYEYDFGDLSGWMYAVDNESPSVGCDQYVLRDGQKIQWLYTTNLGYDLK